MPSKVQLTGGGFQDSEGNVLNLGYLEMELSQDGLVTGVGQVVSGITIRISLTSAGNVSTSPAQSVWGNDQLLPANSYYRVTGYTAAGQRAWGPNNQQVTGSGGTFDVGTWVPNQVISWTPPLQPVVLETEGVENSTQLLLNLKGGGATTVVESAGSVTISTPAATPPAWGDITGTLSDQLDLQAELDLKATVIEVALKAPINSPTLTGVPLAPTPTVGDNSTKIATTAFVTTAVGGGGSSVLSVATITLQASDILSGFRIPMVAAQANKIFWPVTWYAEFIPNTTPYSGTGNFDLKTHGTIDTSWTNYGIDGAGFWNQPVKNMATVPVLQAFGNLGGSSASQTVASLVNAPLDVVMSTNPTLGDGTVVVTVIYYTLSV